MRQCFVTALLRTPELKAVAGLSKALRDTGLRTALSPLSPLSRSPIDLTLGIRFAYDDGQRFVAFR